MPTFKSALLTGIASAALIAPGITAVAQESQEDDDVVVVTGQRGSIVNSLQEKADADSVTDVLSADQADRFPDPNVAEALARIPGISFQRENDTGQGEFISIRGLDASYNTVLFDGLRTGTADQFRRTALDIVTANNISSIRVTKAPLPQDASEGIGGVVDIRTRGPLERREGGYFSIDGRDTTFEDELGYRVAGSYTKRLADNFGVNLSVAYRETYLNTLYVNPASFTLEQVDALQVADANGNLATFIDESEIDLVPGGFVPTSLLTNEQINFEDNNIKRENLNIAGAIDWQVSDNTLLTFGGRFTQDDTTQTTSNIEFDADNGDIRCNSGEFASNSAFEDATPFERSACTDIAPSFFNDPEVTFEGQIEDSEEIQERYFARGFTELDQWTFEYTAGYSRAFEDEPVLSIDYTNDFDDVAGGSSDNDVTFVPLDFSDKKFPAPLPKDLDVFLLAIDPFCENPAESSGRCGEINDFDEDLEDSRENKRYALKFDSTYEFVDAGAWQNVKFGAQYERSEYEQVLIDISDVDDSLGPNGEFLGCDNRYQVPDPNNPGQLISCGPGLGDNNTVIGDLGLVDGSLSGYGRIGNPFTDIGLNGVPLFDPGRLREIRTTFRDSFFASGVGTEPPQIIESEEEFYTAYAQGKWTFGKLDVIGGVRIEQYDADFSAPVTFDSSLIFDTGAGGNSINLAPTAAYEQVETSADNFEWLPRVAFNYNLTDRTVIRASYTTALARPTFDLLAAEVDGNFNIDLIDGADPSTATPADVQEVSLTYNLGNPDLDNAYSHNFDLSAEWYFDDANAFAVAVFYKKIDNFIFNTFALEGDLGATGQDFDPVQAVQTAPFSAEGLSFIDQLGGFDSLLTGNNVDILVRQPTNGDEATVYGAELSFFHTFEYLPGLLSNAGFAGNLTIQETETDIDLGILDENDALVVLGMAQAGDTLTRSFDFFNSPDMTGNAAIYYDDDNWEATLAYRYSGLQLEEISSFGFAQYQQERGFLDFDVEYAFRDFGMFNRATLFFSANDILDDGTEPTTYETNDKNGDIPNFVSFNGRSYRFGVRVSF